MMKQLQVASYKKQNSYSKSAFYFIICILFLGSCGFTPIYSDKNVNITSELANIEISNIPNYEGQYLRNALIDRFYLNARPSNAKYILDISPIEESTKNLDITKSANVTRTQLRLETSITLKDKQSGKVILSRDLSSISSYNILTSEFATRVSAKNMRENTLDDLARQIELQISLYLKR